MFATKFKKGSTKLVIPMFGLNLTNATQLYKLRNNVQLGGFVNAFIMEKDYMHRLQHRHNITTSNLEATNDLSNPQISILPI